MEGWIKIHRRITEHWVWQNDKYSKWWLIILIYVNHEPKKFPVDNKFYTCNPGESFRSLEEWASLFHCSKSTVLNFFKLLKNDGMINTKILGEGNRRKHLLIVVNWKDYQILDTENKTRTVPKIRPEQYLNKNDKEERNNILLSEIDISDIKDENEKFYFQIAHSFYKLFKNNSEELNVEFSNLKNAKYKEWVESIKKLIEIDGRSQEEIREVFRFLKYDEFWKQNIRSTAKLRKKNKNGVTYFEELLIKSRNNGKRNTKGGATDYEVADIIARTFTDQN
jgi:uncharacterized protein (UPF0335 family)